MAKTLSHKDIADSKEIVARFNGLCPAFSMVQNSKDLVHFKINKRLSIFMYLKFASKHLFPFNYNIQFTKTLMSR